MEKIVARRIPGLYCIADSRRKLSELVDRNIGNHTFFGHMRHVVFYPVQERISIQIPWCYLKVKSLINA